MKKNITKINESTLNKIIAESVRKVIRENSYDSNPESGYEQFDELGERAAYSVMRSLEKYKDVDVEAIDRIVMGFETTLKSLVEVGDDENGIKGFGRRMR